MKIWHSYRPCGGGDPNYNRGGNNKKPETNPDARRQEMQKERRHQPRRCSRGDIAAGKAVTPRPPASALLVLEGRLGNNNGGALC